MASAGVSASSFPLVVDASVDRSSLKGLVDEHGAVLLRETGVNSVAAFAELAATFGETDVDMACSAGPRFNVGLNVHTANEAPPDKQIPVHHEMAQCENFPSYVLFYCDRPPSTGGCTPVIRSSLVCQHFRREFPELYRRLSTEGVRYLREYPDSHTTSSPLGKSWREAFETDARADVEATLMRAGAGFEWLPDGSLRTIGPIVNIVREYGGERVCFIAAETSMMERQEGPKKAIVHADKTPLDDASQRALVALGKFALAASARLPWKQHDVLILNNRTVMHSRDAFTGPRRILVTLVR